MANPRKFSEKIALHNHRQAEETAAFEKIMKEVNEVTTQDEAPFTNRAPPYSDGRSRSRSQGGPIRRPHDRKLNTSPYSSSTYLSPPTDTGWRRTNSDSALHQSTMQGMVDKNNDGSNRGWNIPMMNGPDRNLDGRPRSSCDIPSSRVPGISIHTSPHDPNLIQIPIGTNTGSLPDLTNFEFSSPIHAPLDQDHDSSPYSSNHLSVPHRYQHPHLRKNIPLDKNVVNIVDGPDFTQLQGMAGMYQQQCPPTSSSPTLQQGAGYRSPRPSPQSSPSPGGQHSAPCSPGAPSPNDYNIFNQHQAANFQQHFAQLSMTDNPPSTMSYVDQLTNASQMTQSHPGPTLPEVNTIGNIEMTPDAGYYSTSPSQQMYPSASPGLPNNQNSTGVPEIILTDFSGEGDMSRQDSLGQLESDLFPEETLREGLGHLDFDEFRILANPSIGISEIVEDHFRLDHRS